MTHSINKNIILENSEAFRQMMRQQNISGASMNPQDIHRFALMSDGKDVEMTAEHTKNNIINNALNINNLKEKQYALNRESKGFKI